MGNRKKTPPGASRPGAWAVGGTRPVNISGGSASGHQKLEQDFKGTQSGDGRQSNVASATASRPGAATRPGAVAVPGIASRPGAVAVNASTSVLRPDSKQRASFAGSTSGAATRPGAVAVPGIASRPGAVAVPGIASRAGAAAANQTPTTASRPDGKQRASFAGATRPGAVAVPGIASRPGAVAVPGVASSPSAAAASGPDQTPTTASRPDGKQRSSFAGATRPGAVAVPGIASRPGAVAVPGIASRPGAAAASAPDQPSRPDSKQRSSYAGISPSGVVRPGAVAVPGIASRPGATAAASAPDQASRPDGKQRASIAGATRPGAVAVPGIDSRPGAVSVSGTGGEANSRALAKLCSDNLPPPVTEVSVGETSENDPMMLRRSSRIDDKLAAKMRNETARLNHLVSENSQSSLQSSSDAATPGFASMGQAGGRLDGRLMSKLARDHDGQGDGGSGQTFPKMPGSRNQGESVSGRILTKMAAGDNDEQIELVVNQSGGKKKAGDMDEFETVTDKKGDPAKGKGDKCEKGKETITGINAAGEIVTTDLEYGFVDTDELAVAIAIDEEEEMQHVASAVEYDPDAKPAAVTQTRQRSKLYALVAVCICILVAIGSILVILFTKGESVDDTPYRETIGIQEHVQSIVGADALNGTSSPYSKALDWIMNEDPLQLLPDDADFNQRYIAAYFYFATSVEHDWDSCGQPDSEDQTCTYIHMDVKVVSYRWLSSENVCLWAGISCRGASQEVVAIHLEGRNNMTGSFPEGIKYFNFLNKMFLPLGALGGPLPPNLFMDSKHLSYIDLGGNKFTGTIPDEWYNARNLIYFDVTNNLLTGTISSEISTLDDLKILRLRENNFNGTITTELFQMSSLYQLYLEFNQFRGSIPTEIGNLSKVLSVFYLSNNQLTGTIPTELAQLTGIGDLRLEYNELSGTIPDEIYNLVIREDEEEFGLQQFNVNNNKLSGTISEKLWSVWLQKVHLENNMFTGTIPPWNAMDPDKPDRDIVLREIFFNGNDFHGSVPESFCLLFGEIEVHLRDLRADCQEDWDTGEVELECSCCTMCCAKDGSNCLETSD